MSAYYNEFDPFAAAWLRNLIAAGHIAPGEVDERSILDVRPDDLRGFIQCHFFAGIGGWSYALRLAGWPDDRPVWTGSCPCQPFSVAGNANGFADERHLWPFFHYLIEQRRPPVVFGEQVASKDGLAWLDLVHADMEGTGYAFAAVDLCAAGVGAPHIRQRLWFVADAGKAGFREQRTDNHGSAEVADGSQASGGAHDARRREAEFMANPSRAGLEGRDVGEVGHECAAVERGGRAGRLEYCACDGREQRRAESGGRCLACGCEFSGVAQPDEGQRGQGRAGAGSESGALLELTGPSAAEQRPGPTNGHWRDADWLLCRDGKWRPVEPGTFPLAHGVPNRVGLLRGYGNAIVPQVAAEVISAYMDCRP